MDALCNELARRAAEIDRSGTWPAGSLALLAEAGVYGWFVPREDGGLGWTDAEIVRGYVRLASACLDTTFILTQRSAACRRIVVTRNQDLRGRLLGGLARGDIFATVGISHLSTSRRHLGTPALAATRCAGGYILSGATAWATGALHADFIVLGAEMGEAQLLCVVPAEAVQVGPAPKLVALSASCTSSVRVDQLFVPDEDVLAGPEPDVLGTSRTGGTGGLHTSALALGLARGACDHVGRQVVRRPLWAREHRRMVAELDVLEDDLVAFAEGDDTHGKAALRERANDVALGATRLALQVAKGAGFVAGQAPGRWCRQALFFLVWSLPSQAGSPSR